MPGSDAEGSAKTCFVAMPITTPDAYAEKLGDPEHFAHVLAHLFTPALQAAGLTVIPPAVSGAQMIHAEIIKNLEQADFVLCDLSDLNPNVFFELGIRTSLNRPVMHLRDDLTSKIPFDITAINTHTYGSSLTPWSLAAEVPRLTAFVNDVIKSGTSGNAMWQYFGLTKRGEPSEAGADPTQAKLDLILRELANSPSEQSITVRSLMPGMASQDVAELLDLIGDFMRMKGIEKYTIGKMQVIGDRRVLEIILSRNRPPLSPSEVLPLEESMVAAGFGDITVTFNYVLPRG